MRKLGSDSTFPRYQRRHRRAMKLGLTLRSVMMAAGVCRGVRRGVWIGVAACSRSGEAREIALPELIVLNAEVIQVVPGVDAALVTVREFRADRVMADLLDFDDGHLALAELQRLLPRPVAAHLG